MGKVKVRRTNREELPGVAVLRDAAAAELPGFSGGHRVLDLDMELDPHLLHLMAHDPDGFFTAVAREETLGFVAAHVRSRQWVLSELWVLPQHRGKGAGRALLTRALAYGERSGAKEYVAMVPSEAPVQGLLLANGFSPLTPVYVWRLPVQTADDLGNALAAQLPSTEVTEELLKRRGQADLDRIDRLNRNITRDVDHVFWLKSLEQSAAFVRQGARIAAYSYGGAAQAGPVGGATQEAALCGLGWALRATARATRASHVNVKVPARFTPAIEALLDAGAHLQTTLLLYTRGLSSPLDRCVLGSLSVP